MSGPNKLQGEKHAGSGQLMTVAHPFDDIVPITRAAALLGVRLARRNMDAMEAFLIDFGFHAGDRDTNRRYFRGFGTAPWSVEVEASHDDRFVGIVLAARDGKEFELLAEETGAQIVPDPSPRGGRMIELVDPAGFHVRFVHGFGSVDPIEPRPAITNTNTPISKVRINTPVRPPEGPAPVRGIGHVVLRVPDFAATAHWYVRHFGFLASDLLGTSNGHLGLGFFRLDRGEEPTDHHTLALLAGPSPALMHISTETIDLDAVGQGQQHLWHRGHQHHWGIGRHRLGSQIFDYWKDPVGDEWEHYADGDLLNADYPTGFHELDRAGLWTWGHDLPPSLRPPGPAPADAPEPVRELVDALLKRPRPWLD